MEKITIVKGTVEMVGSVAALFDEYRQFYEQVADLEGARRFMTDRLSKGESVIFIATTGVHPVGFAQMYPSFSSISLKPIWILSDLFVSSAARTHGVGTALLDACKRLAVETGAGELMLETMKSNLTAQRLYEARGWKRDDLFYTYHLQI